jgi:energy-coupling factor transport system ATP-binding protein
VERLFVQLPGASRGVLRDLTLRLGRGEVVGVLGASGCGKTTLIRTIAGLIPWQVPARVRGRLMLDGESVLDLDPGQRAHLMATCLDRPEAQLFLRTPRDELSAAGGLYGTSSFAERVVEELRLEPLLDRRVTELSSGERQRVTVGLALMAAPRPILLDEPSAHLDVASAAALSRLLGEIGRLGGSVLAVEQAGWRLGHGVARWVGLTRGAQRDAVVPRAPSMGPPRHAPGNEVVLEATGLRLEAGGRTLLRDVDLSLREGEIVVLTGPNGAGKSTLARVLTALARPAAGTVTVSSGTACLMLPVAELQLFATTVAEEVAGLGAGREELARVLRRHRLQHLAARAPWTLSRGERQRLLHATLDLLRPQVLVADEPGQGLDPESLEGLVRLIHRRAEKGRAYLIITQREELTRAAHRRLEVRNGSVVETGAGPP